MTELLKLIALGILMALMQGVAIEIASLLSFSAYPDLVLVFALAMGLRQPGLGGLVLAFAAGFLIDAGASPSQPGLYALLRGTACALTHVFDRALYLRAGLPWALYVGAYVVVDGILLGLVTHYLVDDAAVSWDAIIRRTPGIAVLTAICAAPLLGMFRRLDSGGGYETAWGLLGSRTR